jgi:hypothetical protein
MHTGDIVFNGKFTNELEQTFDFKITYMSENWYILSIKGVNQPDIVKRELPDYKYNGDTYFHIDAHICDLFRREKTLTDVETEPGIVIYGTFVIL